MSDSEDVISDFLIERHRREMEELNRAIIVIVDSISVIPPDFWEPVKVTVDDDKKFEFVDENWECFICREERTKKTEMECCNQALCDSCVENWFNKESVKCPFCKKDIREN
jgi:hypothetical protein